MKLKGLPKLVYLNAKQDSAQNQLMIEHFDHYGIKDYIRPVSYTHLTLPTICSV